MFYKGGKDDCKGRYFTMSYLTSPCLPGNKFFGDHDPNIDFKIRTNSD